MTAASPTAPGAAPREPPSARGSARADDNRRRLLRAALAVGIVGALLTALGVVLAPRRAMAAYLVAYAAVLWTVLGALVLAAIGALTRASWMEASERPVRAIVRTLPLLALLFVPLALGARLLYPWVPPLPALPPEAAAQLAAKQGYLNVPFWIARAAAYFAVWLLLAWRLSRGTVGAERALGAGALALLALTTTLAAVDWLMSLTPLWSSAAYGPYVLADGVTAALSLAAVLAWSTRRRADPRGAAYDAPVRGRLLLVALLTWIWLGFSQYLIVWSADLQVEVVWYLPRVRGAWGALLLVLLVPGALLPAVLLLARAVHRRATALAVVGAWLLVVHWVHMAWLVLPEVQAGSVVPHWVDVAAMAGVGGLAVAVGVWRSRDA